MSLTTTRPSKRAHKGAEAAQEAALGADTKGLHVSVPVDLRRRLRIRAAEEGRTIRELVEDALNAYLAQK